MFNTTSREARTGILIFLTCTFAISLMFYVLTLRAGVFGATGGLYALGLMWCPALGAHRLSRSSPAARVDGMVVEQRLPGHRLWAAIGLRDHRICRRLALRRRRLGSPVTRTCTAPASV